MFDVGFWELVILFGLGLMVLGPERLPKVAAKVGRWAGQARRMATNLTNQIRDEVEPFESSVKSMDKGLRKDFSALRPDAPGDKPDAKTTAEDADDETVRTVVVDDDDPAAGTDSKS
jgi:sec-independent protein translocase protein TatB